MSSWNEDAAVGSQINYNQWIFTSGTVARYGSNLERYYETCSVMPESIFSS